jgi:hypothetical protein
MGATERMTTYEMIDKAGWVEGVAALADWARNETYPTTFSLFLDLIGWSADEVGEPLYDLRNLPGGSLGFLEIGKLADALGEYTKRPLDVRDWVNEFMAADGES